MIGLGAARERGGCESHRRLPESQLPAEAVEAIVTTVSRRQLLRMLGAAPAAGALRLSPMPPQADAVPALPIGIVTRHLQWTTLEDAIALTQAHGLRRDGVERAPRRAHRAGPRGEGSAARRRSHAQGRTGRDDDHDRDSGCEVAARRRHPADGDGLGIRYYRGGQYFRYDYTRDLASSSRI